MNDQKIQQAYAEFDRRDSIANSKVGCWLALALMPAGSFLMDFFMYRHRLWDFFIFRMVSALMTIGVWGLLRTRWAERYYQWLRMAWYWIPMFFIACMIFSTNDPGAPYYAGFNLVLLTAAVVLPWTYKEIFSTALGAMVAYFVIAFTSGWEFDKYLANNLFFMSCTATIVTTGSYFHSRLRFREFTLRYELERNRQIIEDNNRKLAETNQVIEENNRKLVELDQIKSRFFANISHELRTPLTLLLAPLETILNRFGRSLDSDTKELLATMHSNGMRLLKLINDLLDLVRLESGHLEIKKDPLEVADLTKGLASAVRQVADDKRIRLETVVDPALGTIAGDRDKLEKILLNLLFNALKFTPAGGRVDLRAEKQGEEFVLIVSDTGMGISEKNLPYVFDRFWQADGTSKRKYQGVGIGLALVKELTEAHGGNVAVASQEGKGTTFTIRLPYLKADPSLVPMPEEKPKVVTTEGGTVSSEEWLANLYRRAELFPSVTPLQDTIKPIENVRNGNGNLPRLLVADDEPDMLRFLKSQLVGHYQVIEAVDGMQAVEKASQFLPDIILLDMMMPEKDGMQACREIRAKTSTHSIPIILLTARADEETKLAALKAGASDFLPKPFSTTELHVRIKNLVDSHQSQLKVARQKEALQSTIDQLKETESQLVQSEKLASLGRMSAGIIHEINNPLNFATTGLYSLRNKGKYLAAEQQEEYADILKDVEEGIVRVKTIVSDLRMFTHPDTESRDQVEVADVVTSSLRFLSSEWKDKVRIEQQLPEQQCVWANKNKLIHVLVNLLQNSLDAMRSKTFPEGEMPAIRIEGRVENGNSLLIIRDNGNGIETQHLDKIFDPFYTTKDVGEGMGLGLSICYRIVQEYEGRITVKTEPGKYCEFTLAFPAKG